MSQEEIDLFEASREDYTKKTMKALQVIFLRFHPKAKKYCMCNLVQRKVKSRQFYDWYDQIRN